MLPTLRMSVLSSVSVVVHPLSRRADSAASWAAAVPMSTLPAAWIRLSRFKFWPKKKTPTEKQLSLLLNRGRASSVVPTYVRKCPFLYGASVYVKSMRLQLICQARDVFPKFNTAAPNRKPDTAAVKFLAPKVINGLCPDELLVEKKTWCD